MLVLEVRETDCKSLVFSFDEEGREELLSLCSGLRKPLEHDHLMRGRELSEFAYSGSEYLVYDYLRIEHVPDEDLKQDIRVEDYFNEKGTALMMYLSQRGIDELYRMVLLAKERCKADMDIPHAALKRNDDLVSDDCSIIISLQMVD